MEAHLCESLASASFPETSKEVLNRRVCPFAHRTDRSQKPVLGHVGLRPEGDLDELESPVQLGLCDVPGAR
jgi:hypothetical protein